MIIRRRCMSVVAIVTTVLIYKPMKFGLSLLLVLTDFSILIFIYFYIYNMYMCVLVYIKFYRPRVSPCVCVLFTKIYRSSFLIYVQPWECAPAAVPAQPTNKAPRARHFPIFLFFRCVHSRPALSS